MSLPRRGDIPVAHETSAEGALPFLFTAQAKGMMASCRHFIHSEIANGEAPYQPGATAL